MTYSVHIDWRRFTQELIHDPAPPEGGVFLDRTECSLRALAGHPGPVDQWQRWIVWRATRNLLGESK